MDNTIKLKDGVNGSYRECLAMYGKDYAEFNEQQKMVLGSLVNNTLALTTLFEKTIGAE